MNLDNIITLMNNHRQVLTFLLTWVTAEALLFLAIRLANRFNLHDVPNEDRKIHSKPTPTIGGIPIFIAFFVGIYLSQEGWPQMKFILMGSFTCMILGLIDDMRPLSAVLKLIVLFCVTTVVFYMSEVHVSLTPWESVNLVISLVWIVGMMSAINSLDNMDGLAAGITAIACIFMFFIAWNHWDRYLSFMAVALGAACLTFLKYNFFQPKAGVFLGDNGSYFIGFTLACMVMMGAWTDPNADYNQTERFVKALIVPPFLLGVPIFDIIVATVLRLICGEVKTLREAIVYCGTDHTSHRLVALGFSRRQAVLILWAMGLSLGVISLVIMSSHSPLLYLSLSFVTLVALIIFAMILSRAKVYSHQLNK